MKKRKSFIKMLLSVTFIMSLIMCQFETAYADKPVSLSLDGKAVTCDVPPVIVDGRTLVPLRAVFEAMGADVGWDSASRTARVAYESTVVEVIINSTTAYVDGAAKTLDVPAAITEGRTLIPVRFVSENLGFGVDWDSTSRTVILTSPVPVVEPTPTPTPTPTPAAHTITGITISENSSPAGFTTVTITSDSPLDDLFSTATIDSPDRFYVDFADFTRGSEIKDSITNEDIYSVVGSVRTALNELTVVRVVMDLKEASEAEVTLSSDSKTMTVKFGAYSDAENVQPDKPKVFDPLADGKIVVCIDPGHGKTTGGKRSPDETLMEWEFNRDIAYRLKSYLEDHGIETVMTVEKDDITDPSLEKRVEIANESEADVFVSIHANAYGSEGEWTSPRGWEVYVYKLGGYGELLAAEIEKANIPANGLNNRGMKEANFYVIKNTSMPAVLIEHGFYTNETEVEKLKSDSFREDLAKYDAQGICAFFNIDWEETEN